MSTERRALSIPQSAIRDPQSSVARVHLSAGAREWIIAGAVALVVVALANLPYLLAYYFARAGTAFTGVLMNPEDSNSYLAKMQEGFAGAWLYEIPFTSEPHAPAFLGGFYLLLGQLARVLNFSVIQMWHLARMFFGWTMFMTVFGFIKSLVADARTRWLAYAFAGIGSGLGWVLFLFGQTFWLGAFPVDFKMPEAHLFFTALTFPHFAAGTLLIVASVWLWLKASATGQLRFAISAGVTNLALGIVYPFLIYLIATVLLLNVLAQRFESRRDSSRRSGWREGIFSALALAIPAPLFLYYVMVLRINPVFRAWDAQSITPSPHPLHYVLAYGAMLVLAAPTVRSREFRPLWIWVLAVALLVYAPLNPQRRFVEGVQVPLCLLAAVGLVSYYLPRLRANALFQKLAARPRYSVAGLERLALVLLISFFSISNLYVLARTSVTAAWEQPQPLFLPQSQVRAVEWAGAHLPAGARVLSAYVLGSFIPTRTNLRTVVGHWAETVDFENKYEQVAAFYDRAASDEWRKKVIEQQRVDYIFYGQFERALGEYDPASAANTTRVFDNAEVAIYRAAR